MRAFPVLPAASATRDALLLSFVWPWATRRRSVLTHSFPPLILACALFLFCGSSSLPVLRLYLPCGIVSPHRQTRRHIPPLPPPFPPPLLRESPPSLLLSYQGRLLRPAVAPPAAPPPPQPLLLASSTLPSSLPIQTSSRPPSTPPPRRRPAGTPRRASPPRRPSSPPLPIFTAPSTRYERRHRGWPWPPCFGDRPPRATRRRRSSRPPPSLPGRQ